MIIGLVGENCSGKGTVSAYLEKKGFYYLSLSDAIREDLVSSGQSVTRENLIKKGNELRKEFGASVLAKRITLKIEKDRNYIIDSIRNPHEAKELLSLQDFILVYITANPELRFERMRIRAREADPKSYQEFLKLEELERKNADDKLQNIEQTAKLAKETLINEGNIEQLHYKVDELLSSLSKDFKLVRPSWDDYFMNIAKVVASRSNCIKRKVAAIIVKDKRIISTGYNGTPRGVKNCSEGGCLRCASYGESGKNLSECVCSHGEENAIVQASYHGIEINKSCIYSTFSPCLLCTKMIINAGISEVVYNADYPLAENPLKLLREAGVLVRKL